MSFNGIEADDAEFVPPPVSSFPRCGRDELRVVRVPRGLHFHAAGGTTSASMPALLEGHRLDARISRRGRDDLRVVRKLCSPTSPRQKTWKIGLPILHHNRPIRSPFTAETPSPVSA